jgi:hypothetical protein
MLCIGERALSSPGIEGPWAYSPAHAVLQLEGLIVIRYSLFLGALRECREIQHHFNAKTLGFNFACCHDRGLTNCHRPGVQ